MHFTPLSSFQVFHEPDDLDDWEIRELVLSLSHSWFSIFFFVHPVDTHYGVLSKGSKEFPGSKTGA